jgi:glycosyltransferase involved in cell wall biosynthesis
MNAALTGVQRYTKNILGFFPEKPECVQPSEKWSRGIKGHLWEQVALTGKLHKKLLWSPSNSGPLSYSNQVVTIHDVVSADHPEWFNKAYVKWYNYMLPRLCKKARHIITVSDFTKSRIMELYRVAETKITRVYNGCDDLTTIPVNGSGLMRTPFKQYVLALGSLEPRKNIPLLLASWKNIGNKIPPGTGLIIVGGKGNARIFKDAGINEIPGQVVFTGHLKDEHVAQLYRNALAFVYLSVYEGFGLPPLEAMSAGTPVITGDRTSLPEVVGDAGLKIDPYSQLECENALIELINDRELRMLLAARSKIRAKRFTWEKASADTWQVLQNFN